LGKKKEVKKNGKEGVKCLTMKPGKKKKEV
jgi:hypothetical protein